MELLTQRGDFAFQLLDLVVVGKFLIGVKGQRDGFAEGILPPDEELELALDSGSLIGGACRHGGRCWVEGRRVFRQLFAKRKSRCLYSIELDIVFILFQNAVVVLPLKGSILAFEQDDFIVVQCLQQFEGLFYGIFGNELTNLVLHE